MPIKAMSSAVTAWVCSIAVFVSAGLTMEVQMVVQLHVTWCVELLAAAWDRIGIEQTLAGNGIDVT